jgi:hypothetical protein
MSLKGIRLQSRWALKPKASLLEKAIWMSLLLIILGKKAAFN